MLDRGLESTRELGASYVETMGLGFDRTVRNFSYFFDGYEDVYENLKYEDDRFFLMVKETIKGKNPIMEIALRYVKHLLANLDDDEMKNLNTLLKGVFFGAGLLTTTGAVRVYIATAVSELVYNRGLMLNGTVLHVNNFLFDKSKYNGHRKMPSKRCLFNEKWHLTDSVVY